MAECPLDSEKFAKNWEKEGENQEKAGKNQEGSFTLPLLTDRAGYATGIDKAFVMKLSTKTLLLTVDKHCKHHDKVSTKTLAVRSLTMLLFCTFLPQNKCPGCRESLWIISFKKWKQIHVV